jgi:hypothetical protein
MDKPSQEKGNRGQKEDRGMGAGARVATVELTGSRDRRRRCQFFLALGCEGSKGVAFAYSV